MPEDFLIFLNDASFHLVQFDPNLCRSHKFSYLPKIDKISHKTDEIRYVIFIKTSLDKGVC